MNGYKALIHSYIQHRNEIIKTLKGLIKIPSVQDAAEENAPFGTGNARILKHIEHLYFKNAFETELRNDKGYLLSYSGEGDKSLGLFAHADVVPVSDDWVFTAPFEPV